jgi:hypothetical protein
MGLDKGAANHSSDEEVSPKKHRTVKSVATVEDEGKSSEPDFNQV